MARIIGGRRDDLLFGRGADDFLKGLRGADALSGGGGSDRLLGGRGDDVLVGGGGRDRLLGGGGDDVIALDEGRDVARGGGGEDRFVVVDGTARDRIADFSARDDVIDFVALGVRRQRQLDFERDGDGGVTISFRGHAVKVEGDFTLRALKTAIDYADRQVLRFEDLRPRGETAFDAERLDGFADYRGLEWHNFGVLNVPKFNRENDSGYNAFSGRTALYTVGTSVIEDDEPFDFESVRAAGAWRDRLKVVITGYAGAEEVGAQTFTLGRHGRLRKLELDDDIFDAVSRVEITSYGGRPTDETSSNWVNVSLDNVELFT